MLNFSQRRRMLYVEKKIVSGFEPGQPDPLGIAMGIDLGYKIFKCFD